MSMYNMLHGEHGIGQVLVEVLILVDPGVSVGRYRDGWTEKDGDRVVIRIHTRNGGGNRECYCDEGEEHHCLQSAIESMQAHPWYLKDEDDSYDCTYADFYFVPDPAKLGDMALDVFQAVMPAMVAMAEDHIDMSARWQAVFDGIKQAGETPKRMTATPPGANPAT